MNNLDCNTLVCKNVRKWVLGLFLGMSLVNTCTQASVIYTAPDNSKNVVIGLGELKDKSLGLAKGTLKAVKYAYNHVGLVFSKNTLATVAILAWPILKYNPELLSEIAQYGTDIVIQVNGAIAQGIVEGLIKNPKALTQLVALMSAKDIGSKVVGKIGTVIATALVGKLS